MPLFHSPLAMKILIQKNNDEIWRKIQSLEGDVFKYEESKKILKLLKNPQYIKHNHNPNKKDTVPTLYRDRDEEIEEILKIIWERNQQAKSSNPLKRLLELDRSKLAKKQCTEELDLSCGEELDLSCGEELDLSCGEELDSSYGEKLYLSCDEGEIDDTSRSSSPLFNPPSEPSFPPLKSKGENNPVAPNVGLSQ